MKTLIEYKGYHAKISYDAENKIFVGDVIGIEDFLAFHVYSADEVEKRFHECIDDYLDFCKKRGEKPSKEYRGMFNVRISPELHRLAALEAANRGISLNQLVSDLMSEALQKS